MMDITHSAHSNKPKSCASETICHPSIGAQDKPLYALNQYGNAQSGMVTDIELAISGLISLFGNV